MDRKRKFLEFIETKHVELTKLPDLIWKSSFDTLDFATLLDSDDTQIHTLALKLSQKLKVSNPKFIDFYMAQKTAEKEEKLKVKEI